MPISLTSDRMAMVLTGLTILGIIPATYAFFAGPNALGVIGLSAVFLAGGIPAAWRALKTLWEEYVLDIDLLMVIAAATAAAVGAPFEGAVLLTLFSISTTLEHRAMARARNAVEALMTLRPDTALRERADGIVEEVKAAELCPGDIVVLRPGARVPADSIVFEGEGSMDEATITGESMPVHKSPGSKVFEATVNQNSVLRIKVEHRVAESTVARMIALVTEAQAARAPSERFSDWFGQRYTIGVLAGAVLAFVSFYWLGWPARDAFYRAATLLVTASPCAIVISVPSAILSALAVCARGGVLFKGGKALEMLAEIDIFAFDKTGTLTTGKAEVTGLETLIPESEFLSLLAGLEAHSEHPIAEAIRNYATLHGIQWADVDRVTAIPSEGVVGHTSTGAEVWAGNSRMVSRKKANVDIAALEALGRHAETVIYLGRGHEILGAVTVADQPRISSVAGLDALRRDGLKKLVMLTGDRRAVALRIGAKLGFSPEDIHADLLPEDKVRLVGALAEGGRVAFVGDGVNDAAALARSDVGIAMGVAGSEVALQAADVALLSDNMERLAAARRVARRTRRIIRQNLAFAIGAMVLLAFSSLFLSLPMPLAVLGHEGGTVLVVLNGLRLLADPIRGSREK
ncbi:cation-translocating P-type ATPase [Brucella sp. 10RB9210]|uniref:heavy metal translocating P-type ATPase n=1 Tax=Brucella sp. 10RB9210 TaxID=1844037 RepID=UPI0012AE26BE|nr:cation-translocating P-type ATPase [Brucella sp. 10RB9210]MRN78207.1 heavy metal translocating P-type ATPase [Brucella sp. 10RB9210]